MALAQYMGYETLTYLQFTDAATGKTLTCEPGQIYDILPEMPEDGRFIPAVQVEMKTYDTAPEGEENSPEESGENV